MSDERPKPTAKALANLAPQFKPGQSGNPGGAPRGKKLSTCLRDMMDLTPEELFKKTVDNKLTIREQIAAKWAVKMLGRDLMEPVDMRAIETALDRLEGSVAQTLNVKNPADRSGKSDAELSAIMARWQTRPTTTPPTQ